ncbi:MAG: hypothetical protein ACRDJX_09470 [Solirubrobacteraceae bacterium]
MALAFERKRLKGAEASFSSTGLPFGKDGFPDEWWLEIDQGPWVSVYRDRDDCWHVYIDHERIPEEQRDRGGNPYLLVAMGEHPRAAHQPQPEAGLNDAPPEPTLSDAEQVAGLPEAQRAFQNLIRTVRYFWERSSGGHNDGWYHLRAALIEAERFEVALQPPPANAYQRRKREERAELRPPPVPQTAEEAWIVEAGECGPRRPLPGMNLCPHCGEPIKIRERPPEVLSSEPGSEVPGASAQPEAELNAPQPAAELIELFEYTRETPRERDPVDPAIEAQAVQLWEESPTFDDFGRSWENVDDGFKDYFRNQAYSRQSRLRHRLRVGVIGAYAQARRRGRD